MRSPLFKKLDILIVKAFIGPFIATFFVTVFVLVLQFFWLYIDDVVGKGVDTFTVMRLIMYLAATLVPLALPLAMLLSSIMTLGNLGETFELIAIKSAGISLLRFMRPLFVVALLLTVTAFFFNNNVLPIANLKMNALKSDIINKRPAFDIREGVFYDRVQGFVIKIGKKDKDGKTIHDVVIYEHDEASPKQDNMIIADSGTMLVSPDKQSLIFTLKHGTRYQEKPTGGPFATQLVRMSFDTYKKVMDLSAFKMKMTDESAYKNNYQMKTLFELGHLIDSIRHKNDFEIANATRAIDASLKFPKMLDTTGWNKVEADTRPSKFLLPTAAVTDSIYRSWKKAHAERDSVDKAQATLQARAKKIADSTRALAAKQQVQHPSPTTAPSSPASTTAHASPAPTTSPASTTAHASPTPSTSPTAHASPASTTAHASPTQAVATNSASTHPGAAMTPQSATGPHPPTTAHPTTAVHPAPAPKIVIPIPGGQYMNTLSTMPQPPPLSFEDLLPDSVRQSVIERASMAVSNAKMGADGPAQVYRNDLDNLRQHEIAWHEKLTYAVAVLVMFLIGAPLGSIIRKGGIGLPLVFAVIFFVIFFLLNNFGRKFTKEGVMSPLDGMWMATYVLTPIGIFLTYKAMHDSQLFNKEFYFRATRAVRKLLQRFRHRRREEAAEA